MFATHLDEVPKEPVGAGEKTWKQVLIGSDRGPNFAMRRFIIEPGGFMPMHTNTVEHEQLVLAGEAEIDTADGPIRVRRGSVLLMPAGEPHAYRCLGDEAFEFLCLVPNGEDRIELVDP